VERQQQTTESYSPVFALAGYDGQALWRLVAAVYTAEPLTPKGEGCPGQRPGNALGMELDIFVAFVGYVELHIMSEANAQCPIDGRSPAWFR
jgi:hypothetical protein